MKRLGSIVISTILVFCLVAPSAFAAEEVLRVEKKSTPTSASAPTLAPAAVETSQTPTPPKPVYKKVVAYTSSTKKKTKAYSAPGGKKAKVLVTYKSVKKITFTETAKKGWYTAKVKVGKKTKKGYFKKAQIDWPKKGKKVKQYNMKYKLNVYKAPTSKKVIKKISMRGKVNIKPFTQQWYVATVKVKSGKKTKKVKGYIKKSDIAYSKKFLKKKTKWILIDQSSFKLTLFAGNKVVKKYGCTLGMPGHATPNGNFKITLKRPRPVWGNPDKAGWGANMPATIGPGPNNPLGLRALNLNVGAIRIHGSARPQIGTRSSHGCIRLTNKNIVDLFKRVKVGTQVVIRK